MDAAVARRVRTISVVFKTDSMQGAESSFMTSRACCHLLRKSGVTPCSSSLHVPWIKMETRTGPGVEPAILLPPVQHVEGGRLSKEREQTAGGHCLKSVATDRVHLRHYIPQARPNPRRARPACSGPGPDREQVKAWRTEGLDATVPTSATGAEMLVLFEATRIALRRVFEGGNENERRRGS